MQKLFLIIMMLCATIDNVSAQSVSEDKIREQIELAATNMKTMQCDFVQTKYLRMLNDKMVSTGNVLSTER